MHLTFKNVPFSIHNLVKVYLTAVLLFHNFLFHTGSTLQACNKKKANTTYIRWSIGDDFDRYEEKIS